jgi:glycosyltransferase involved in cell wall biosynthesis
VVIGDGPLRAGYEARASRLGLRCRFLGVQPSTVVRAWMARAAVFCVPSVVAESGDAEGFGMVFIEAQAMGLPVVSTLSGGIPEAVQHGETGLLVPEHDPKGLAAALLLLLENPEVWRRYSVAGRRRVLNHFDLAQQTARLEEVFEHLVGGR